MDPQHGDGSFTDDEKTTLGQQQSAMIQMQNVNERIIIERHQDQELRGVQQQAMIMRKDEEMPNIQQHPMQIPGPPMAPHPVAAVSAPQAVNRPPQQMGIPPQQPMSNTQPQFSMLPPLMRAVPQQMGGAPQRMGGPSQQMSGAPRQMGGPPQQLSGPPQQMGGPPQQMGGPPQRMGGPPQQMSGSPQQMSGAPRQMGGPPRQMGGPPQQLGGPPQQLSGPPQQMGGPPQQMGGPPQQMGGPPQRMMGQPQRMGGPPQRMAGLPQRMGGPPQQISGAGRENTEEGQFGAGRSSGEKKPPSLMQIEARPGPNQSQDRMEDDENVDEYDEEFRLPAALEKMLEFKDARLQEVGVRPEEMERIDKGEFVEDEGSAKEQELVQRKQAMLQQQQQQFLDDDDDDEEKEASKTSKKESKNKKRKKKKKKAKQRRAEQVPPAHTEEADDTDDVEIEYIPEELVLDRTDPSYREFAKIFQAFKIAEPEAITDDATDKEKKPEAPKEKPPKAFGEDSSSDDSDTGEAKPTGDDEKTKLSKKKQKKLTRLSVAELKQLVTRPDVVEMHDVTAKDPKLLVHLKATRNTVPVPRHWCFKRKYLQGKRGIEKMPFDLPDFIKNTGIMEMRQALQEKEDAKNLKAKMREKVRPKMGKIDIDYQKLHDAFFKYQTKPKMTIHGDLYYEGKEFETRLKEKKPGDLSDDIRTALGMPLGPNASKYPPPWLIAMQRYGPPPSYPNLKISGLNAPIPESCAFGYHAGGWGKPPVDETGKPLYGDVFGQNMNDIPAPKEEDEVDQTLWGELESESEEEESDESDSEEEREPTEAEASGLITPADPGLITPSGVTSVPVGVETPDMIELRKKRIEDAMDQGGDTPALYQVLKEKGTAVGASMMGSAHVYDMQSGKRAGDSAEGVEVALNPDELDLDTAAIQAKYDQQMRESQLEKEDLSDMVADHQAKQSKKRKKIQQQESKSAKKYKEFKF